MKNCCQALLVIVLAATLLVGALIPSRGQTVLTYQVIENHYTNPKTTFSMGNRLVGIYWTMTDLPANSQFRFRYYRPDGSLATWPDGVTPADFFAYPHNPFYSWSWWWYIWWVKLDVPGTWRLVLDINGRTMVNTPFTVIPTPDLVATSFSYQVPIDATHQINGTVPVNAPLIPAIVVANRGTADAGHFVISFFLSLDEVIDPFTDVYIGSSLVDSLARGTSVLRTPVLNLLDARISSAFAGKKCWIGAMVDSDNEVTESDESNNSNQGEGVDRKSDLRLYDPVRPRSFIIDPRTSKPRTFSNTIAAGLYLLRQGFNPPLPYIPGLGYPDIGWSMELPDTGFSWFNGEIMPAGAFRIQAGIVPTKLPSTPPFRILVQGEWTFSGSQIVPLAGEPNPRKALDLTLFYPGWFDYVRDYHNRF